MHRKLLSSSPDTSGQAPDYSTVRNHRDSDWNGWLSPPPYENTFPPLQNHSFEADIFRKRCSTGYPPDPCADPPDSNPPHDTWHAGIVPHAVHRGTGLPLFCNPLEAVPLWPVPSLLLRSFGENDKRPGLCRLRHEHIPADRRVPPCYSVLPS